MLRGITFMFLAVLITNIRCEKGGRLKDVQEKKRVLGVDAVHDGKIDKDTITYRNMKRGKRETGENSASSPEEVNVHIQQLRANISECLEEVSSPENSPGNIDCAIACAFKRYGIIVNGKENKENVLTLLKNFYTEEVSLMKKMEEQVDQCLDSQGGEDECEQAESLNECINNLLDYNKHMLTENQ